jgi:hypothetical protein
MNYSTFHPKLYHKAIKIWVWDPGVKKIPDPGSRSAILYVLYFASSQDENLTTNITYQ